jgi:hypothetical protein
MRKVLVAVVGACLLVLGVSTQAAHAQQITICEPDQACETVATHDLQAVINDVAPGSVLTLANGVYTARNVVINSNITIVGSDPRNTILQPAEEPCIWVKPNGIEKRRDVTETERIFEVRRGNVTLENLTIRNGCAVGLAPQDVQGGGIISNGTLNLRRVILERNVAWVQVVPTTLGSTSGESKAQGGAIYNGGILNIDSSTVISNAAVTDAGAALGGGIYNELSAYVINSTISGNHAGELIDGGTLFAGGGIFSFGSRFHAEYNSFVGNVALTAGGGVAHEGPATLINNLFYGNQSLAGTADCIHAPPPAAGSDFYSIAPMCDVPRPVGIALQGVTDDTIVPVYTPKVDLKTRSGSLDAGDCSIATVKVDQLGGLRGLNGKCDLGAVDGGMSFIPIVYAADAKPDLIVRDVRIEPAGEINAGMKVTITVVIENISRLATPARFYIDLFINPKQTPPNKAGVSWIDLCRTEKCNGDQGVVWLSPTINDGKTFTFTADIDNDAFVVRESSKFGRYLPEGKVEIWVYVDSAGRNRSPFGAIDELVETNNQFYKQLIVKPGRIMPVAAADQMPPSGLTPVEP